METISDRLKIMMREHKLSQKEIGDGIGKTPQMMSHFLGQAVLPMDFVREFCSSLNEPLYKAIMSKDEIAAISGVNPVLAPIVEELDRIVAEKSRAEQELTFRTVYAMLKAV